MKHGLARLKAHEHGCEVVDVLVLPGQPARVVELYADEHELRTGRHRFLRPGGIDALRAEATIMDRAGLAVTFTA